MSRVRDKQYKKITTKLLSALKRQNVYGLLIMSNAVRIVGQVARHPPHSR